MQTVLQSILHEPAWWQFSGCRTPLPIRVTTQVDIRSAKLKGLVNNLRKANYWVNCSFLEQGLVAILIATAALQTYYNGSHTNKIQDLAVNLSKFLSSKLYETSNRTDR